MTLPFFFSAGKSKTEREARASSCVTMKVSELKGGERKKEKRNREKRKGKRERNNEHRNRPRGTRVQVVGVEAAAPPRRVVSNVDIEKEERARDRQTDREREKERERAEERTAGRAATGTGLVPRVTTSV